jgi:hypothetical protein
MCSSGAFLNFGHSDPPIKMGEITLNDVPASGGSPRSTPTSARPSRAARAASSTAARTSSRTCCAGAPCAARDRPGHRLLPAHRDRHAGHTRRPQPGVPLQPAQRLPELRGRGEQRRPGPLHLPRHAAAAARQRDVLLGGSALAAAERPDLPHDRGRDALLRCGRARLRRLGGHAAQPQPGSATSNGVPVAPAGTIAVIADLKQASHEYFSAATSPATASARSWGSASRSRCSTRSSPPRSRSPMPS